MNRTLSYDLLENETARHSAIVQNLCLEGEGALVSNPLYRCFQLIQVIECIIAIVSLPLVYCRYIQSAAFHINLKILLCLYYQIAGVYVLVVLICTIFQAVLWLTSRNPCDVYPSRFAHEFFNLSELYCLLYLLASQPLVSLERTIATLRVDTYEKCSKKSAAVLYVIASVSLRFFNIVLQREENLELNSC
ncbi:hypothetical protein NECAME_00470, partial [Necator americanus]